MALDNYGRIMQGSADFAMMPYNALQDSRNQQKRNTLLELQAQRMQGQLDDDAEWDQAYAAKDVDTMMRIAPQETQLLMQHWQQQKLAPFSDITITAEPMDMPIAPPQVQDIGGARVIMQGGQYKGQVARPPAPRAAAAPRAQRVSGESQMGTDGNGAVIDYGKTTDGERTAVGYLDRIVSARQSIESPALTNYVPSMSAFMAFASLLDDDTGVVGATTANKFLDDTDREYMGQALDLILAKMRKESGATIKGGEFRKEYINLFPMPNDPPKVLADKKIKRQLAENQLRKASGRAAGPVAIEPAAPAAAPAAPVQEGNIVEWDSL
jgi:hypothetical protein